MHLHVVTHPPSRASQKDSQCRNQPSMNPAGCMSAQRCPRHRCHIPHPRGARDRTCMEQNFGPHMEQKCAVLAGSCGSVASWNSRAVTGSSDRLNWSYLQ